MYSQNKDANPFIP